MASRNLDIVRKLDVRVVTKLDGLVGECNRWTGICGTKPVFTAPTNHIHANPIDKDIIGAAAHFFKRGPSIRSGITIKDGKADHRRCFLIHAEADARLPNRIIVVPPGRCEANLTIIDKDARKGVSLVIKRVIVTDASRTVDRECDVPIDYGRCFHNVEEGNKKAYL